DACSFWRRLRPACDPRSFRGYRCLHALRGDPAMSFSENIKRAIGAVFFIVLAAGYYWWEHRPEPEEKETQGKPQVVVTKATGVCFSDQVRVTGFIVPRREAVVGVDQEGSRVISVAVREGDTVTDNQEMAQLTAPQQPGQQQQQQQQGRPGLMSLKA